MALHDHALFEMGLSKATFISIDGYMFRIVVWELDESELHYEDEESGEQYVSTFEELLEDIDGIELLVLENFTFRKVA